MSLSVLPVSANANEWHLAIGGYTKDPQSGINVAKFNPETGAIGTATVAVASPNPSFLAWHPGGRFLYAANESGTFEGHPGGGASAFQVDAETGKIQLLNSVSIPGGPCHLCVDATGKFLLVANYGSGTVSVWKLEADGRIGERTAFVQHEGSSVNLSRQKSPHAHQVIVSPDNRFALVADLGLDRVLIYRFDAHTGTLTPNNSVSIALKPGAGPRHLTFGADGRFLYVINELDNTVTVFRFADGRSEPVHTASTLPTDFAGNSSTAEIAVHPNGQFAFGSNRGHDSIVTFQIDGKDGTLKAVAHTPTEGRNPRHFSLDPSGRWLLVANQNDKTVVVFRIDPNTGALTKTSVLTDIPGDPTCVTFFPASP